MVTVTLKRPMPTSAVHEAMRTLTRKGPMLKLTLQGARPRSSLLRCNWCGRSGAHRADAHISGAWAMPALPRKGPMFQSCVAGAGAPIIAIMLQGAVAAVTLNGPMPTLFVHGAMFALTREGPMPKATLQGPMPKSSSLRLNGPWPQ